MQDSKQSKAGQPITGQGKEAATGGLIIQPTMMTRLDEKLIGYGADEIENHSSHSHGGTGG